jgi:hypothetical protein
MVDQLCWLGFLPSSVVLWRVRWTVSILVGMFAVFVLAGRGGWVIDLLFLDQHSLLVHCLYDKVFPSVHM